MSTTPGSATACRTSCARSWTRSSSAWAHSLSDRALRRGPYAECVALPFLPSDAGLLALQAGVVAAPRAAPRIPVLERLRGPAWAIVPVASIVLVVFAIRFVSDTATGLTYLALVAVPPLAALALAWAARGARPPAAIGAAVLFALAWIFRTSLVGEGAGAVVSALSCVTPGG